MPGRTAFILGGTGQIGLAVAEAFLAAGWCVTATHRGSRPVPGGLSERGARTVLLDRDRPGALASALGSGADVLVDTTAYDRDHGSQLIAVQGSIGRVVVVSSASVYRDDGGRTLDEAMQSGFPDLPDPIAETHPTVDPGPGTYSTRKVALERSLLDGAAVPVTVLRPCAVHGAYSRHPREWWVVKRVLDGRPTIPLAYEGASRFQTTAAANVAAVALAAAAAGGSQVLNVADPDTPTVAEMATAIARHLGYRGEILGIDDPSYPPSIGRTPWSVPRPFVVSGDAARRTGYAPATSYADAVGTVCDDLVSEAGNGPWQDRYPVLAAYPRNLFDYAAEDAVLSSRYGLAESDFGRLACQPSGREA